MGRARRRRAVLARADGPPVPRRRRHGRARPARRSPTPRVAAPGAAPRSTAASTAARRTRCIDRWRTQPPHRRPRPGRARTRSATRSRRSSRCRPCPGRDRRRARSCAGAPTALGWRARRDPAVDGRTRRAATPRHGPAPEHDRDVPAARRRGRRRLLTGHRVDRLVLDGGRADAGRGHRSPTARAAPSTAGDVIVCGGAIQTPALLQRSGLRRSIGRTLAVHPTVKLAARFDDDVNVPDDVPVHQVKEFAPDLSFGGSASNPVSSRWRSATQWERFGDGRSTDWRHIGVYYAAITSEGRGTRAGRAGLARSAGDLPADPARSDAARPGARRDWRLLHARGRRHRGVPVVPRRARRAPRRRPGHRCGRPSPPRGPAS